MTGRRPPHLYSAAYVLLWEGRKVLLSKRLNTGFKDGLFGLPGGHVNPGENPIAAAVREAHEEVGVIIKHSDISVLSVLHRTLALKTEDMTPGRQVAQREYIDFFCSVKSWEGQIVNMEPRKCSALEFHDVDHLPPTLIDYVRRGIHNGLKGRVFSEYAVSQAAKDENI